MKYKKKKMEYSLVRYFSVTVIIIKIKHLPLGMFIWFNKHKKYPHVSALIYNKKIYAEKKNFKNKHDKSSLFSLKNKKINAIILYKRI